MLCIFTGYIQPQLNDCSDTYFGEQVLWKQWQRLLDNSILSATKYYSLRCLRLHSMRGMFTRRFWAAPPLVGLVVCLAMLPPNQVTADATDGGSASEAA